jgi:hypothetical protein
MAMMRREYLLMRKAQRVTLILYFFMLAYCCAWIPWKGTNDLGGQRMGYGWVWAGPRYPKPPAPLAVPTTTPEKADQPVASYESWEVEEGDPVGDQHREWDSMSRFAIPDLTLFSFRIIAASALAGAAFIASLPKPAAGPR